MLKCYADRQMTSPIGESKENWALLHILLVSECHVDVRCVHFVITYGFGILEVMSGVLC